MIRPDQRSTKKTLHGMISMPWSVSAAAGRTIPVFAGGPCIRLRRREPFEVVGLGVLGALDFHRHLMIPQYKVDFQLGGRAPVS